MFSLFKAIVGSGILSLANAISRWTDNPAHIAPVVLLSVSAPGSTPLPRTCVGCTHPTYWWGRCPSLHVTGIIDCEIGGD